MANRPLTPEISQVLWLNSLLLGSLLRLPSYDGSLKLNKFFWSNQRYRTSLSNSTVTADMGSVQFSSVAQSCLTLCDPMNRSTLPSLSITNSWSPSKPMSIELVMPFNHLILCCPLLLLPSIFPSIKVFTMSQLFAAGGQSIGVSASISVLPMNTQD